MKTVLYLYFWTITAKRDLKQIKIYFENMIILINNLKGICHEFKILIFELLTSNLNEYPQLAKTSETIFDYFYDLVPYHETFHHETFQHIG